MSTGHTRREFLKAIGAGSAWIALLNTPGCKPAERGEQPTRHSQQTRHSLPAQPRHLQQGFRSRPELSPPTIEVTTQAHGTAPGYIFVAPKIGPGQDGPMIIDNLGRLVWFIKDRFPRDFKVQRYRGEPVLTWWEGEIVQGHGVGEYVIFDDSYREVTRVQAGNGYRGDLHEFSITPQDTTLLMAYNAVPTNLSRVGGPGEGAVWDGIAQELDIETGEVLFEWHSLDHVALEESYYRLSGDTDNPFDYFHINSIDVDHDENLLISARNTST
ncbi:MAG: arylsulfotransferase family protein, partial [Chloroflexota bacterium]|nr:arylsulfotransferase family protein [Chloroflexota bacterium]